jgi:hypothetical protein
MQGPLPASLPASPPLGSHSTKGMRITPVVEGMVIPQVTGVVRRSRSGPVSRGRACPRTRQALRRGVSGCGFRCRKRPARESTVPSSRRSALGSSFARTLDESSGVLLQLCYEIVRCLAHLRSGADFFSHPSRGVAAFSSPSPSVTPATFDRFEIVWRGAARCSVVR